MADCSQLVHSLPNGGGEFEPNMNLKAEQAVLIIFVQVAESSASGIKVSPSFKAPCIRDSSPAIRSNNSCNDGLIKNPALDVSQSQGTALLKLYIASFRQLVPYRIMLVFFPVHHLERLPGGFECHVKELKTVGHATTVIFGMRLLWKVVWTDLKIDKVCGTARKYCVSLH